jgi:VWFA-related protein
VLVPVSVLLPEGGPATNLTVADFVVREDGLPQEIGLFQRDAAPVDALLLLDASASAAASMEVIQKAARDFLARLRPMDAVSIVTFADQTRLLSDWTPPEKTRSVPLEGIAPSGNTALYTSLTTTIAGRFSTRPASHRRVVLVLTDGLDTQGGDWFEASRTALRRDVSVYVISTSRTLEVVLAERSEGRLVPGGRRAQLRHMRATLRSAGKQITALAEATGGRAIFPRGELDLAQAFRQIWEEISARYLLGFYSPDTTREGFHAITVTTKQASLRVHAREGYFKVNQHPRTDAR